MSEPATDPLHNVPVADGAMATGADGSHDDLHGDDLHGDDLHGDDLHGDDLQAAGASVHGAWDHAISDEGPDAWSASEAAALASEAYDERGHLYGSETGYGDDEDGYDPGDDLAARVFENAADSIRPSWDEALETASGVHELTAAEGDEDAYEGGSSAAGDSGFAQVRAGRESGVHAAVEAVPEDWAQHAGTDASYDDADHDYGASADSGIVSYESGGDISGDTDEDAAYPDLSRRPLSEQIAGISGLPRAGRLKLGQAAPTLLYASSVLMFLAVAVVLAVVIRSRSPLAIVDDAAARGPAVVMDASPAFSDRAVAPLRRDRGPGPSLPADHGYDDTSRGRYTGASSISQAYEMRRAAMRRARSIRNRADRQSRTVRN